MRTDDQWFEPGDKVMRVMYATQLGLPCPGLTELNPDTDYGRVLCVERCWECLGTNSVTFVGLTPYNDNGWYARCFRRVSEIQLCVRAAERLKEPVREGERV